MDIKKLADEIYEEMVAWRRELHQKPELSFEEHQTAGFIDRKLTEFGLDRVERFCETAVIGILKGGKGEGKCMAIRADIDALPVTEQTGYAYASKREGLMHACGHDGHVAILLATAKLMAEHREEFRGTIKFIFEQGEELFPGGAKLLVQAGVMENPHVDAIIGLHIVPSETCGKIRIQSGPVAIGCDTVNVTVTGKSGHAARPHEAKDALLAACQYVVALQQIVSRGIDPKDTAIISVGTLQAGIKVNIIADHAEMSINARSYDLKSREIVKQRLYEIGEGMEKVTGCQFDLEYVDGYEPTVNHEEIVDLVLAACRKHLGEESIEVGEFNLGSDDFSYYMNATHTPGAYFFLLAGHDGEEIYANHHPKFTWKEEAMKAGLEAYLAVLTEYLR